VRVATAQDLPAIGETLARAFDPALASRYERHGFRPTAQVDLVGGLSTTVMWRGARTYA
jgi:hypothetical protein